LAVSIKELLTKLIELGGSDMHIVVGAPPIVRINGGLETLDGYRSLRPDDTQEIIYSVMNEEQVAQFESERECDLSFGIEGLSRFRLNVYRDRGSVVGAFRAIPFEINGFDELGLPRIISDFSYKPLGLVLVCGPTGSGKSTTLAAIIDKINRERNVHIITIEDPIEFVQLCKKGHVNQREVGAHTQTFGNALRAALREAPDVIMVGEMRDLETTSLAITAAETGHLVFGTLHTPDAVRTIGRVLDVFPPKEQGQIRAMFSESLRGIISQLLLPSIDESGQVLAVEVLVNTPAIGNMIREDRAFQIPGLMQTGKKLGMQTMDDSLIELVKQKRITPEVAVTNATNPKQVAQTVGATVKQLITN